MTFALCKSPLQNAAVSSTYPPAMRKLFQNWFGAPELVETASEDAPEPTIADDPSLLPDRQRMLALEGDVAQLRLEWAETLDKLSNWASRQAARDRKVFGKQLAADPEESRELAPMSQAESTGAAPTKQELRARLAQLQRKAIGGR